MYVSNIKIVFSEFVARCASRRCPPEKSINEFQLWPKGLDGRKYTVNFDYTPDSYQKDFMGNVDTAQGACVLAGLECYKKKY